MKLPMWAGVTAGVLVVGAGLVTALVATTPTPAPMAAAVPAGQPVAADDAVQRALRAGKSTVAEFGANSCAQCREMKPILEGLQREFGQHIAVVNVDLIKQREVNYIQRYGIQLMPTQVFFDAQGREIGRHLGKITGEEILARLQVRLDGPRPKGAPAAPGGAL